MAVALVAVVVAPEQVPGGPTSPVTALLGWSSGSGRATATPPAPPAPSAPAAANGPAPYVVVGLGDSVPAAGGCACTSFVSLLGDAVARRTGRPTSVDNLAAGGLTTSSLIVQLQQPDVRARVAAADLLVVTIGANDFDPAILTTPACRPTGSVPCYRTTLAAQRTWLTTVLSQVSALTAPRHPAVLVTGYWNVFLDGAVGRSRGPDYLAASDTLTRQDNAQIAAVTAAGGGTFVDLYTPFRGNGDVDDTPLLAPDGDHPNQAGHQLIARTLLPNVP